MDEPSPTARDVLAAYRRRRVLPRDAHARVQARLADSIAHREHERNTAEARHETRRRVAVAAVVALAAAAAIVLFVRGLRSEAARPGDRDDRGQAPYEHTTDERELPLEPREPDATPESTHATAPAVITPPARTTNQPEPPTRRAPRTEAPVRDATLAEELAIVRRVHTALDRDDADAALAAIAEHERRFATGQLVEERKSLRVEALCRAGKAPQARAEAATFLREHARSPHADRVRSACPKP
jgi:hypothetical protein